jgi:ribonuclease HII
MKKLTLKEVKIIISTMQFEKAIEYLQHIGESTSLNVDKLISQLEKKNEKIQLELIRLQELNKYENSAYFEGHNIIAGVDEAGRGPLAGPVVAAAVVFPKDTVIMGLDDSKKLSAKTREELYDQIVEKSLSYAVGIVDEKIIDQINILNATKKAMKIAVDKLSPKPDMVLVDAVEISDISQKQLPIIKGDSLSISIAAASIIAKVTRDRIMDDYCAQFPGYAFSKHKGYGTKEHISAIKKDGICPIHRVSFTKNFIAGR